MPDLLPDLLEDGGRRVRVTLDMPPGVVNIGVGRHGGTLHQETFVLPGLWQLHLYAWTGELTVAGVTHPVRPGHVSLVPPGTPVHFRYRGRSEHLYAHLRLPGGEAPAGVHSLPVMQDAGGQAETLSVMLRQALASAGRFPAQASAEIWATLWRIAQLAQAARDGRHRAVDRAMRYIEARLAARINVPEVAAHAGISHTHLTRLFREATGDTVVAYIRRRRLAHAGHLLRQTTLSIPAVAAAVGIADLQAFNKLCRRELGASPRALRTSL